MSTYGSAWNVKVLVGTFDQEKVLVGALFVIVESSRTFVPSSSRDMMPASVAPAMFVFDERV